MNPETIKRIQQDLSRLSETYNEILAKVRALVINEQLYLRKNTTIPPGIACKVAYDMNGLILRSEKLVASDIPQLSIDHIAGLRAALNDKASVSSVKTLSVSSTQAVAPTPVIAGTATKVNYNAQGMVISGADLLPEDIPQLPISKIDGLEELLERLKSFLHNEVEESIRHPNVAPSTYTKVVVDEHGHVTVGLRLEMTDIPIDLITRINLLESKLPDSTPRTLFDGLAKLVTNKLDKGPGVPAGTYTKVVVNGDGVVTRGDTLTIQDLPDLKISDITDLRVELNQKASVSDVTAINEMISKMSKNVSQIGEVLAMKSQLEAKAEEKDLRLLESRMQRIEELFTRTMEKLPGDVILDQITAIQGSISAIHGRLEFVEKIINSKILV